VLLFVFSIALNIGSFVGSALWTSASLAWSGVTGVKSFAASQVELVDNERQQRKVAQKAADQAVDEKRIAKRNLRDAQINLTSERKLLKSANTEITIQKNTVKKLKAEAVDPFLKQVTYKGRKMVLKEAVAETSNTISKRAAKSAAREIASMPAESLPFWGTAVIVGVTTIELIDLCNTIKDMNALQRAFDPELTPTEDETTVCSMKTPSKEALWKTAKAAPGEAWAAAREATPNLEEIKEWDLPDVDYNALWVSTKSGTASYSSWVKDSASGSAASLWSSTKDAAGTAVDATKSGTDSFLSIFNSDD
jgi:hypothetical protein